MSSIKILAWIIKSMPYILNIGIIASYMILIVMLIRLFFKNAPKNIICGMWGIVVLRLFVPMSMLESRFSLVPAVKTIQTEVFSYQGQALLKPAVIDLVKNPIYPDSLSLKLPTSVSSLIDGISLFAVIWFVGLIAMLLYVVISTLLLKQKLMTATLLEPGIKQIETIYSPFLLGIFKPTIYLPYSINECDIKYVVAHEKAHVKRGDHIWKLLGFIVLSFYWFNPLFWAAYTMFCRDIEVGCDEAVIKDAQDEDRRLYATALLNCSVKNPVLSVCPLAFGEVSVKDRIKYIMGFKKITLREIVIASALCVALAAGFITEPKVIADSTDVSNYYGSYNSTANSSYSSTALHGNFHFPCDSREIEEVYDLTVGNETYRTQLNFIGNSGDPVYAVAKGTVTFAGYEQGYGNKITIHNSSYNLITIYLFLDDIYVEEGDFVNYGDVIGTMGKSGLTAEAKLGFRLVKDFKQIDPMIIFRNNTDELNTDYDFNDDPAGRWSTPVQLEPFCYSF